jgi:Photosystem P840 reaction-centre cytochrome c-551
MKKIPALIVCLIWGVTMLLGLPDAQAQKKEESPNTPSQKKLFETKCQKCHSLDRIKDAHLTTDKAKTVVERMRKKAGADISPTDAESIYRYLGDYFIIPPPQPAPPVPIQ